MCFYIEEVSLQENVKENTSTLQLYIYISFFDAH